MRRRGAIAIASVVVLAGALAGCGGGQRLSSGELQTQATRVCTLAAQQTSRIQTPASPAGSAVFLRQGIAALTPALTQLRKLRAPEDVADVYSASVKAFAQKLDDLRAAEQEINAGGDPVSTMQSLQQRLGPIVSQENGGWQALNIPACVNH
jgi:hypothetical protein